MNRRNALLLGAAALFPAVKPLFASSAAETLAASSGPDWASLGRKLGQRLQPVEWPLRQCIEEPASKATETFFEAAQNPYFLGDDPGLTQTFGWVDAWFAEPSAYVVRAGSADDVVAAIQFAKKHGIPISVRGGGHSYHGTSNKAGSLLVWTRAMDGIQVHDTFSPTGAPQSETAPAVSVQAGAIWAQVYEQVAVRAGRYVQGGGCLTVGVAGLVQGGGFGSFSKTFGLAAASLLEAEIVTADGAVRIVNAWQDPDLFFALKGGGGGTFGIVTRMTLATHALPETFGAVFAEVSASSDEAFRDLIGEVMTFYADRLFNPTWGEQLSFRPGNRLLISMVFQGLSQQEAEAVWRPFFTWVSSRPEAYSVASEPVVLAVPARSFWDAEFLRTLPGIVVTDDSPGATKDRIFWASNREEAGQVIHAYQSAWVPADLLEDARRGDLVDALFAASRHWGISLHTNKGLAGSPAQIRSAALQTAVNPVVVDAFALAICGAEGPPAYPGVDGREPDQAVARMQRKRVDEAMAAFRSRTSARGSYLYESDYFEPEWEAAYWGDNYARLAAAKLKYDPDSLFEVHHGVATSVRVNEPRSQKRR